jgi:hypothetical protein
VLDQPEPCRSTTPVPPRLKRNKKFSYAQACDPVHTFHSVKSILWPLRSVVQTARPTQDTRDYYRLSAKLFSFKKRNTQSESNFSIINEAEKDQTHHQSLITSSQP